MTDVEWKQYKQDRLNELDPVLVAPAVEMLKTELVEALPDLQARIAEDPIHWLGGRKQMTCWHCAGEGTNPDNGDRCRVCKGLKLSNEWPLHHGWGTSVRNLLRDKGFGEKYFGIDNLDDYYQGLVELAAA